MGTVAEDNDGLVRRMCAYNKAISEPVRMKMIKALGSAPNETLSVGRPRNSCTYRNPWQASI